MPFKRKTEKRLDFPFLKIKSFNQSFWNNLSQNLGVVYDEFGPLPIRIKSQNVVAKHWKFEDFTLQFELCMENFRFLVI